MVEEGGLRSRGGYDRDLLWSALIQLLFEREDKPTVSLSSNNIFIFAAEVPVAALSPADTILVM
jgi:hypothetical protein